MALIINHKIQLIFFSKAEQIVEKEIAEKDCMRSTIIVRELESYLF